MPEDRGKRTLKGPPDTVRLRLTPEARKALSDALVGRPPGSGVRIWVERGIRPHAQMMVDLPSRRDLPLELDGVPLLLDENSVPFLRDAEVRYRSDRDPPGFEVVGPFLPSGSPSRAPAPEAPQPTASGAVEKERAEIEQRIREALKNLYDPEIPMNVIDLGLIYGMDWSDSGELTIRMTLTSPGCPVVEAFTEEVTRAARDASGLDRVKVDIVWDPPWGPDRMSEFARRQFGYA